MPVMTQNDFLNPLFSLNPILVALIIWATGWGYLFLAALRINTLDILLKHPGYMIGDFLLIPLAGFLITYFYQTIDNPIASVISVKWTYFAAIVAIFGPILAILGSILINKTPHTIWYLPHLVFIWFMIYILINFLIKGLLQLLSSSTPLLWVVYMSVILVMSVHLIFPLIFGFKTAV